MPVEKYTPHFKTSVNASGQLGGIWGVLDGKKLAEWTPNAQKAWSREMNPGAWPFDHHGWFTMDRLAKDGRRAERLHKWAGLCITGCLASYFVIRNVKDWKYGHGK